MNTLNAAMNAGAISEEVVHGAYQEGWEAFYDKTPQPYANPFSAAGEAWEEGWMAAYRNDRECREMGVY